ncbi:MAG: diaminopropionate ammonia-lyase, partial [Alphaproteobacteria bacterium]|nr:diaminopropionate ammonia-lyase [Alphaproteobacteria bacterium]
MFEEFESARMGHVAGLRRSGDAAGRVLTAADFAGAAQEIGQWEGYAPTPLVELDALAGALGLAKVLYKDEGPRFGLGSFKALGGAYAALRV